MGMHPKMTLSTPVEVQTRLEGIDTDLAELQNRMEDAAYRHFIAKREKEKAKATAFLTAKGSIAARNAIADVETATDGMEAEAQWESLRAKGRVLETRAMIGSALLKSQGRS